MSRRRFPAGPLGRCTPAAGSSAAIGRRFAGGRLLLGGRGPLGSGAPRRGRGGRRVSGAVSRAPPSPGASRFPLRRRFGASRRLPAVMA